MVKKLVTGLALSVGAGLALSARNSRKGGRAANVTPVTIRVHKAALRPGLVKAAHPGPQSVEEQTVCVEVEPNPALAAHAVEVPLSPARDHSTELAELRMMIENIDQRTGEMMSSVSQRIDDLQNHLPRFIDVKVSSRLREVEERLRAEFRDGQSKTFDMFLQTLDSKVLPRLSNVEDAVERQSEEIGRMRSRIDRTDETIASVVARIDRVVDSMAAGSFPGYASSQVYAIDKKAVA
jgi:hypothetical protein